MVAGGAVLEGRACYVLQGGVFTVSDLCRCRMFVISRRVLASLGLTGFRTSLRKSNQHSGSRRFLLGMCSWVVYSNSVSDRRSQQIFQLVVLPLGLPSVRPLVLPLVLPLSPVGATVVFRWFSRFLPLVLPFVLPLVLPLALPLFPVVSRWCSRWCSRRCSHWCL